MRQHGADPARLGLEAVEAQQRIEPDETAAGFVQPLHLGLEPGDIVALQPVGDQQHDRALPQRAPRPQPVERVQRLADARAAGPVLDRSRAIGKRVVGIAMAHLARQIGQPRAEHEGMDAAALFGERVQEMQENARVLAHRPGNVGQHDKRWVNLARRTELRQDKIAAGPQGTAHHRPRIGSPPARIGAVSSRHDEVMRQAKLGNRLLGIGDLGRGHLGEVLLAQHFPAGDREPRIDLDLGQVARRLVAFVAFEHRLADAGFGSARLLFLARVRGNRRKHRQHLLDQLTRLPEQPERLVEGRVVFAPVDQHGMQRPVEIVARADARREYRLDGILDRRRPDAHARLAQRAGEIDDVVGKPPVRFRGLRRGSVFLHRGPTRPPTVRP